MPLHLLPKKSWNVYNAANIARVRADEAEAAAREAAEEQRQQEVDAARRLAILRGEEPPPLSPPRESTQDDASVGTKRRREDDGPPYKKQKKHRRKWGEDETDFEMRVAMDRLDEGRRAEDCGATTTHKKFDGPLTDARGHIDLVGDMAVELAAQETDPGALKQRRRAEREDPTLRFSHAAGRDGNIVQKKGPWYSSSGVEVGDSLMNAPGTNVWGNEDPNRKAREAARISASDPLVAMRVGSTRAREVNEERQRLKEEREREIRRLKKEEKRERRKRRREGRDDEDEGADSLEGFSLDAAVPNGQEGRETERRARHNHGRQHKSRSRDREKDRERKHHHRRRDGEMRRDHSSGRRHERDDERYRPQRGDSDRRHTYRSEREQNKD